MKKALIIVDFQNDFVDGALGFPDACKLDDIIVDKLKENRNIADLIFTFDTHEQDYLHTMEGQKLPVPHCIKGSVGHNIYGKTAGYLADAVACFDKPSFGSVELGRYLQQQNYEIVELCGLVSNICVLSNAVLAKAFLPEAQIIVDSKATDSFDKQLHRETMDVLKGIHITVI